MFLGGGWALWLSLLLWRAWGNARNRMLKNKPDAASELAPNDTLAAGCSAFGEQHR